MVRYSAHPENTTKSCKAKGSNLRVSFKVRKYFKTSLYRLQYTYFNYYQSKHTLKFICATYNCPNKTGMGYCCYSLTVCQKLVTLYKFAY